MNSWRNLVPAPLAAPETRALKAARLRTMTGLFLSLPSLSRSGLFGR